MSEPAETSASAGRELGALVRAMRSGRTVDASDVLVTFHRMLGGEASTASDALALLTMARTLLYGHPERVAHDEMTAEHRLILSLLNKAITALEAATGEWEFTYSGFGPALILNAVRE